MAFHHSPRIITDGLVLSLDAADKNSYPGSGTTWTDLSGNGNNLTFSASPVITNGIWDNNNGTYAYGNTISVNSSTGYSIEILCKINSDNANTWQNIFQNGASPNRHMVWYNTNNTLAALFHTPNSYNNITETLVTGDWYYLQFVYGNGGNDDRKAWFNGESKTVANTAAGNVTTSGGYLTLSSDSSLGGNTSDISYSFVRYYNKALSDNEVLQNFNAHRHRFGV
jgi:hypothetical protein